MLDDSSAAVQLSVDDVTCAICQEILLDPTSLACGHTFCRHCLAKWWYNSFNNTCPTCRRCWNDYPGINMVIKNLMQKTLSQQLRIRQKSRTDEHDVSKALQAFEEKLINRNSTEKNSFKTVFAFGLGFLLALFIVLGLWMLHVFGTSLLPNYVPNVKQISDWNETDVAHWIGTLGDWSKGKYDKLFLESKIDGKRLLNISDDDLRGHSLNITHTHHRWLILNGLFSLQQKLLRFNIRSILHYQLVSRSGFSIFILYGMKIAPRTTVFFLYLFYYDDYEPVMSALYSSMINNEQVPAILSSTLPKLWFILLWLLVPYSLMGLVAHELQEISPWISYTLVFHSIVLTITEAINVTHLDGRIWRQVPFMAINRLLTVLRIFVQYLIIDPFIPAYISQFLLRLQCVMLSYDSLKSIIRIIRSLL